MIFNSLEFALFFVVFFALYWFVVHQNLRLQNFLLLAGSYFFYSYWDYRFLLLIIFCSALNYFLGIAIHNSKSEKQKKIFLIIGILQGVGGLIFFKYYNFFILSFVKAFSFFNVTLNIHAISIALPLGISFYTFRILSYLFDIHKGKIEPSKDWLVFFSYVAFFPSLMSGPIDRASKLIPQLEKNRTFNISLASDGMRQILWGLFKKFVIADNCGTITDQIFENYHTVSSSTLILGAFYYTIQLYADFSGYSDMAIGFARLLGFDITKNFDYPFFSQNIASFWRKWHMSLTSWLTEFVFTPLTIYFRDYDKLGLILSILINFTVIGLWHGDNWTYVLFGFLHGCYYIPLIIRGTLNKKNKIADSKLLPSAKEAFNMLLTFVLVMIGFILFRSATITDAANYFTSIFSSSIVAIPKYYSIPTTIFILIMIAAEWLQRSKHHALDISLIVSPLIRRSIYFLIVFLIGIFGALNNTEFLYFKF